MRIERPDPVWSTDITYVPLVSGFMYLAAILDWYSRYVLAWRLSNTLDGSLCLDMLEEALSKGQPEVFNTDQGVQFTAQAWTGRLESGRGGGAHGRAGSLPGQRLRGTPGEVGEIRRCVAAGLRVGAPVARRFGTVLPVLQ